MLGPVRVGQVPDLITNRKSSVLKPLRCLLLLWTASDFLSAGGVAATLQVKHDHDPWGSCLGELTITPQSVRFAGKTKPEHTRVWSWLDTKTVEGLLSERFTIVAYEDQKLLMGRDRPWDFTVRDDNLASLDDATFSMILRQLERPVVDHVAAPAQQPTYEIPVKHLHTFGGCKGVLVLSREWIVYRTDHVKGQRSWRRTSDMATVLSTGRYDLEVEVYEQGAQDLLQTRRFRFELKRLLEENVYRRLRRELSTIR